MPTTHFINSPAYSFFTRFGFHRERFQFSAGVHPSLEYRDMLVVIQMHADITCMLYLHGHDQTVAAYVVDNAAHLRHRCLGTRTTGGKMSRARTASPNIFSIHVGTQSRNIPQILGIWSAYTKEGCPQLFYGTKLLLCTGSTNE